MDIQPDAQSARESSPNTESNLNAPFEVFSKIRARLPRVRSLLLKRKSNEPSLLSAERAPAADVLKATQIIQVPRAPGVPERLPDIPQTAANALPDVPALHTFKGDVAQTIAKRNISLAAIAQAQAQKQGGAPANNHSWLRDHWTSLLLISGGGIVTLAAIGVLLVSFLPYAPTKQVTPTSPSIIYLDKTETIAATPQESRSELMQALVEAQGESIPLGLVEQLVITVASSVPSATAPMDVPGFFNTIAPNAPDALARSLSPQFLLGLHSYNGNQPFLIFKTDSYSYTQAYAGMLSWESTMQQDLSPLFPISIASSSATSTASTTSTAAGVIIPTPFADAVVDNHEARVLRDQSGNIELLWSFIDQQTLIIATNANTLAEIVSRLQKAPTITIPGN